MAAKTLNILLVEDVDIAQKMGVITLKQLECPIHIDAASTGAEALELFNKHKYNVVFMDLGLPDTTGVDVAKKMLKLNKNVFIIALTAHDDDEFRQECKNIGMVDFIEKPLTIERCRQIFDKLGIVQT